MGTSANSLAVAPEESSIRYPGWRVVLAAHVSVMLSFGSLLVFTFSVFLKPLTAEFGWGREEVSRAFGLAAMAVAVASPFLGRMLDRGSPRRIVLLCLCVFGLAFASLRFLTADLRHLYAVFLVLGLVGNGTTQMGFSGAVSSWFTRRRGMALALVMAGTGIGSMLLPPLAQALIDAGGWRHAYLVLGGLVLLAGVPMTALFLHVRPQDSAARARVQSPSHSVPEALRSRVFWILAATLFLSSVAANSAITQMAALLTDRGLSTAQAAWAASALGGASFAGRLLTGAWLDRFFGPRVALFLLTLLAAGILLLAVADSVAAGLVAAVLIGFGLGGEADITPFLLARYFGLASFSTLYGLTWTFYAVAGGIGPVLAGRAYDLTGSYRTILLGLAVATLLSAILMLWMPRYSESSERASA